MGFLATMGASCDNDRWERCPEMTKLHYQANSRMRNWSYPSINLVLTFDSHASFQPSWRKITQYYEDPRVPGRQLEQIDCQGVTDERCFNLSKCEQDKTG